MITILGLYKKMVNMVNFFPWERQELTLHCTGRNREMETYGLPDALIKVDPSGPYAPLNASKISKVH